MKVKTVKGKIVKVHNDEIYNALAKINDLVEIGGNTWVHPLGSIKYVLTRKGFVIKK